MEAASKMGMSGTAKNQLLSSLVYMSTAEFGKLFGVSHVAVIKWEKGTRANPSTDFCIRLYMFDHLKKTKDKDFRNFYHKISLENLAKSTNNKIGPLTIDDFETLKSA